MSIMDELKKLTRPYDDDGAMDDELDDMDTGLDDDAFTRRAAPQGQPAPQPQPQPQAAQPQASPITMGGMNMGGLGSMGAEPQRSSVNPMGQGYSASLSKSRVVLVAPSKLDFDKAKVAVNCFRDGAAVILNCEKLKPEETNRLKDFFSGCVYALDGTMCRAAKDAFIMVPNGVGLDEDKKEESEEEDEA